MPASAPKAQREPEPPKPHVPCVYTLEATGLLVIALLMLVIYVVRYWHHIPWSAH